MLAPVLWSFDEFVRNSARNWYGGESRNAEGAESEVGGSGNGSVEGGEESGVPEVEKRRAAMMAATTAEIEAN